MKRISSQPPGPEKTEPTSEKRETVDISQSTDWLSSPVSRQPDLNLKSRSAFASSLVWNQAEKPASILRSANYYQTEFDQMVI